MNWKQLRFHSVQTQSMLSSFILQSSAEKTEAFASVQKYLLPYDQTTQSNAHALT
jgi:hypothetical protein